MLVRGNSNCTVYKLADMWSGYANTVQILRSASLSCKITFTAEYKTYILLVINELVRRMVKQLRTLQLLYIIVLNTFNDEVDELKSSSSSTQFQILLVLMRKDFWYVVFLHFLIMYLLTLLIEDNSEVFVDVRLFLDKSIGEFSMVYKEFVL